MTVTPTDLPVSKLEPDGLAGGRMRFMVITPPTLEFTASSQSRCASCCGKISPGDPVAMLKAAGWLRGKIVHQGWMKAVDLG